jgi:soluble lytic murein transglycosylase-like protein
LRLVIAVMLLGEFVLPSGAIAAGTIFSSQYDDLIRAAVKRYWLDYPDWLEWKAQLYQESRLDPNAVSSVGAQGLAQFMPATWQDIERTLGYGAVSRKLAGPAIEGGAYYMMSLRKQWSSRRSTDDRQWLAQASYNAGIGSLLDAQKACGAPVTYGEIIVCLPGVTGQSNAQQTSDYVARIWQWRAMLKD